VVLKIFKVAAVVKKRASVR